MPRGQAIREDLQLAREYFRDGNPGYQGVDLIRTEERNVQVRVLSVGHDLARTRGNCHPDYTIYRADYEYRCDYEVFYTKPTGEIASYVVNGTWKTVVNEQWMDTSEHCEYGAEDLPPVPDDYCLVRSGDRVLHAGPLSELDIRVYTKRAAQAEWTPPEQKGAPPSGIAG